MKDTTICSGDTILLRVQSDAFTFKWSPAQQVLNPAVAEALAVTNNKTTYSLQANIGSCSTTGLVTVSTVPYPHASAGRDTTLCFGTSAQLTGTTVGSSFNWTPASGLNNAALMRPTATPSRSTTYILHAYDTLGCPKPGDDTVLVTVLANIVASAGNDTAAVINQPLQLTASGGVRYFWSPNIGLSATNIANPVALYNETFNQIQYRVLVFNEANCSDSAYVTVRVFNTGPSVFVPTAFTPNGDGRNDVLRPIAVGIKQLDYFKIFNRWGQQVFVTQLNGKGWDGSINGSPQMTGTYVWAVKATDYKGVAFVKKGTVTLIK
jgi:gliding motility-associated-like protein